MKYLALSHIYLPTQPIPVMLTIDTIVNFPVFQTFCSIF